ncbi:MAG: dihydropteroate synthase [Candidatus Omnitrophica bacterium]|nr:dihydropteroate synthase [Candidatus Omnitrophota bacterium]
MRRRKTFVVQARDYRLSVGERTLLMGILNVTPDSFSGDGVLTQGKDLKAAVRYGLDMVRQGADIIDVGGESSRPGATRISVAEEIKRVVPVIRELSRKINVPISVDTYKPDVASAALDAGASIVNVIKGTPVSERLLRIVLRYRAAIVLMHMRGTPKTMQRHVSYKDVLGEITLEFKKSIEKCIRIGIKRDSIIVDPGIGFAKTAEQNFLIMKNLSMFRELNLPILIGPSRKSFIAKVLNLPAGERLIPTASTVALSVLGGAHIVRVHDVCEMKQSAEIADAVVNAN